MESAGEAAIIDPLRDPEPYIKMAADRGAVIKYVLETHFHADFVSGHIDLAAKTGAAIVYGPNACPGYTVCVAMDGDELPLGKMRIKVLHTPGHTIESTCYLAVNEQDREVAIFTGDTLLVGEVGRPDLLSGNLSKEELAAMLFDSLQQKIKSLPDDVTVYPGHGPGSACGKNIGKETWSTIGAQKQSNYALLEIDKDKFIKIVTSDLPVPPAYFFKDAAINQSGYQPLDKVIAASLKPLSINKFKDHRQFGSIVLDTRDASSFGACFIPGAINIGLKGDFAVCVGTLIPFNASLLIVTEEGHEQEAISRLARIGYDNVLGYLQGGMKAWIDANNATDSVPTYSATGCWQLMGEGNYHLLDVRKDAEVAKERIKGAMHVSLNKLQEQSALMNWESPYIVYCAGGYRSMIAASLLKRAGFKHIANVEGGINEVKKIMPQLLEIGKPRASCRPGI
jgi:glyoxylase-like metal-dependent hydrolase (beta-lactamase superfamily II)/rhodanese-related sulfurtransferase